MSIRTASAVEAWTRQTLEATPSELVEIISSRALMWSPALLAGRRELLDPGPPVDPCRSEWPEEAFLRFAIRDPAFAERLAVAVVLFFGAPKPEHLVFRSPNGWLVSQAFLRLAAGFREPYVTDAVLFWFESQRPSLDSVLKWSVPRAGRSFAAIGRAALVALARTAHVRYGGVPGRAFWRTVHERGPAALQPAAWAGRSLAEPDVFVPGLLRLVAEGVPMRGFAPWIRIAVEHPTCLERWRSLQESLVEARGIDI